MLEREIAPQLRDLRRSRVDFAEIVRELRTHAAGAVVGDAEQCLERVLADVA